MNNALARVILLGSCGICVLIFSGCQIWPFMSNEDGRKVRDMGKADQVMYPDAPHPVHLNESFGNAYRTARDNQILNPDASKNLDVVRGKDGIATHETMKLYRKSYSKPASKKGSSSGGGKK